jgi:cytochrome c-type biogenesis protein CcmH
MMRLLRLTLLAVLLATPLWAVQPDEVLSDPAQEARAREISRELRCLVCRNESIDDSNAGLARDLRLLVRERITAGDSNEEVITFVVDRYGEYVLLRPRATGSNLLLWMAGPGMLLLAGWIGIAFIRKRRDDTVIALNAEEQARLDQLLKE